MDANKAYREWLEERLLKRKEEWETNKYDQTSMWLYIELEHCLKKLNECTGTK